MEKLSVGELVEPYMGYKVGATIVSYSGTDGKNMFNLLFDNGDENLGFAFSTDLRPVIEVKETLKLQSNITKFWTYLNLINAGNVKIPTTFKLFVDEEKYKDEVVDVDKEK